MSSPTVSSIRAVGTSSVTSVSTAAFTGWVCFRKRTSSTPSEASGRAGVIDAAAQLFYAFSGDDPFRLYTLLVVVSVGLSAFIDNIPYVAAMLPVVQSIAAQMNGGAGFPPELFYFGLLTGATLGGNLTPIGASANIAAIGILRKHGEAVTTRDFLRIGVPFTLSAVAAGYLYLWAVWGS